MSLSRHERFVVPATSGRFFRFDFGPGLPVARRKHRVEYPAENVHAARDVKHRFPFFRALQKPRTLDSRTISEQNRTKQNKN